MPDLARAGLLRARDENTFERWGARSLLIAKFVPGLNTIAPPMAGITAMPLPRFLLLDGLGALLYIGTFVLIGWVWSDEIEAIAESLAALGGRVPFVLGAALIAWVLAKFVRRWLFLRELRIARITPEELKQRMESGEAVVVVDLRHSTDSAGRARASPARSASPSTTSRRATIASRAIARSSSSARDRTKRPAPGWRCCFASGE